MLGIYLDYNATAPLRPEVKEAIIKTLDPPANPSSIHHFGQSARVLLEEARGAVADCVGAKPEEVIFTSGGTEANAIALKDSKKPIATSAIEHVAVLESAPKATRIPVDNQGIIQLDALEDWLKKQQESALVAVMLANNETGVIQPIKEATTLAHNYGAKLHCDAVQGLGKVDINFAELGVDSMAISAHKIGAPAGVGALILREGYKLPPLARGGGQEKNRRPGTENITGIVGFGTAARLADPSAFEAHCKPLQEKFEAKITSTAPDAVIFGKKAPRLANTTSVAMPNTSSELQVMTLDLAGIAVSAGAACSSGKMEASHVLKAMGAESLADKAIRVSSGWASTPQDIDALAEAWLKLYKQK